MRLNKKGCHLRQPSSFIISDPEMRPNGEYPSGVIGLGSIEYLFSVYVFHSPIRL